MIRAKLASQKPVAWAARGGWVKGDSEGAFEFAQRKCYAQGVEDARKPAQPQDVFEQAAQLCEARGQAYGGHCAMHIRAMKEQIK
jgi:hypothetical protein